MTTETRTWPSRRTLLSVAALLALCAQLLGCAVEAAPSTVADATPTIAPATTTIAPATSVVPTPTFASPIEGVWSTGPVPIAQIRAALGEAGVPGDLVDGWVEEVGAPPEYTFDLEFRGKTFGHYESTPAMPRQLGEAGTFVLMDGELILDIVAQGDTYRLGVELAGGTMRLRFLDSTEHGAAEDQAKHKRYTIAFYSSAPFVRQP